MSPPTNQFEINNGSNAIFNCSVLAFPEHQIFWTFTSDSGFEIPVLSTEDGMDTPKYHINRENGAATFGMLTVMNVNFQDHGMYSCNASNEIGFAVASATLTVHGKLIMHATLLCPVRVCHIYSCLHSHVFKL